MAVSFTLKLKILRSCETSGTPCLFTSPKNRRLKFDLSFVWVRNLVFHTQGEDRMAQQPNVKLVAPPCKGKDLAPIPHMLQCKDNSVVLV